MKTPINWLCLIAILSLLLFAAGSCNTQKHIVKESMTIDSTALIEKSDSIRFLKLDNEKLLTQIKELSYVQILFDTVFVAGDTVVNTVIIKDDGSVETTGKIKSLTISKEKLTSLIAEKNRVIDSLQRVKQKEKIIVQTVTETKTRDVVKKIVPGYVWWLLVLGILIGAFLYHKFKI